MKTARVLIVLALLLAPASGSFAQNLFYGFDSDMDGWSNLRPQDVIDWDATMGNPPGSLLSHHGSVAASPCLSAGPRGDWHLQADVFSAGAQGCELTFESWSYPDCSTGGAIGAIAFDQATVDNQWVTLSFDFDLALIYPYFRIELIPRSGVGVCYFDNVQAVGPLAAAEIPTLGTYGQILFALALLGAGVIVFRRMHG